MAPLRVCLVTQQLASVRSGVGTYARQLLEGLLARGVECVVATFEHEKSDRYPGARLLPLRSHPFEIHASVSPLDQILVVLKSRVGDGFSGGFLLWDLQSGRYEGGPPRGVPLLVYNLGETVRRGGAALES